MLFSSSTLLIPKLIMLSETSDRRCPSFTIIKFGIREGSKSCSRATFAGMRVSIRCSPGAIRSDLESATATLKNASDDLMTKNFISKIKIIDEGDVKNLSLMCDSIHEHGGLAGVELTHATGFSLNAETREPARAPSQIPHEFEAMASARSMTIKEIKEIQREHVDGALRAKAAGFDLLTVYVGLSTIAQNFLYPYHNKRTDEYGGSFENRCRFTRELLEMMREEIDDCAIGIRFPIDSLEEPFGYGDLGIKAEDEGVAFIKAMDDLVDYWDINIGTLNWGEDAGSSRFFDSNHQAQYTKHAKKASKSFR